MSMDIPEVHLLVHLLVLGLGDDLVPHYCLQSSKSKETHSGGSGKRSTPSSSSSMSASSSDDPVLNCPAKALISYILPAVAQLQVSTWKAQVAEEIITASNSVWSTGVEVSGGTVSTSSQRQSSSSSSSHESSRESINPPPPPPLVWQKRIKGKLYLSLERLDFFILILISALLHTIFFDIAMEFSTCDIGSLNFAGRP
ncbi:unnamed protein product [Trichobilharzia regenti]|nr:unnamed protein product [Trichobilharzia regenti]